MLSKKKNKVNSLFCPDKADTKACRKKTNVYVKKQQPCGWMNGGKNVSGKIIFLIVKKMLLTFV